jgi:hypothetical protein
MSADFQRLASVRARQRSRRTRWVRAVAALGMGTGLIALGWLVVPRLPGLLLPVLGQGVASLSPAAWLVVDAHGEARGWVETVEPHTGIIRVSSGVLGLMSVALLVTPETLIVVRDKEGGFGDIRQGERVVAADEVRRGALEAKRVEMFPPPGVGN